MEETINFKELLMVFKKRFVLIVVTMLGLTLVSGVYTRVLITPMYQASTQLVVSTSNREGVVTQSEVSANIQLINTYTDILRSPFILDQVIESLDLDMDARRLRERMSAGNQTNSQVITLTVRHENPETAQEIADATAEKFYYELPGIMNIDHVSILARAQLPTSPVSPRLLINVAMGFMLGTILGVVLAFLLEFLDKTIANEEEVEKLINVPVLGTIATMTPETTRIQRL